MAPKKYKYPGITTIRVKVATKKRLDEYGKRGQSDDEVINELLDKANVGK